MEEKKGLANSFVQDAINSMSNDSEQKPVNVQINPESSYNEKIANAQKGSNFNKSKLGNNNFRKNQRTSSSSNSDNNIKFNNDQYIKWFQELSNKDVSVAGGKGASLGEMYNNKFPVPPGFVVTAQSFAYFIEKAGIKNKIAEILKNLDLEDTESLNNASKQIRRLIEEKKIPKELEEEILESYHILGSEKIDEHNISKDALNILKNSHEPIFVSVRSSATTEDLATASFAGQQESFLNVKGDRRLIEYVKRCFSSLYTPRAIYYRTKKGFKHEESLLAVVVQKMVDSEKSGVVFSKNPMGNAEDIIVEAVFGLGEGIVSGRIKPDNYLVSRELKIKSAKTADKKIAIIRKSSGENEIIRLSHEKSNSQVLTSGEIIEIADLAVKLEEHYKKPQDIEFAIEQGKVYIVQSRPITTLKKQEKKKTISGNLILEGLGSSPGIGVGVVKIIKDLKGLSKIKKGDVLVTEMTNPDMVVAMQKSVAIVTDEGGMTAHASIVSREMGIPAVVGTGEATSLLKDGTKITVDGYNGKIYEGEVSETQTAEIKPAVETQRIKLKLIVDLPEFAERATQAKIDSIGLTRIEGIIASSKKHPLLYEKENNLEDYTKLLKEGIEKILEPFNSMWIRASDIRTDEYASLQGAPEKEVNPMLGFHGIRFSLEHPKILEAELQAIKQVAKENPSKKIGIMFPQIISIEEVKKAKEYFNKFKTENMQFGVMIETPASVQIIDDICQEVDFISFGTNDLTQYTLAVDRGEDKVQELYNELHPAIFSQINRVIRACRRYKVETSICGQAGSKKEMVEFLFRKGIDSISVNADAAYEISTLIRQLEQEWEKQKQEKTQQMQEIRQQQNQNRKNRRAEKRRGNRFEKQRFKEGNYNKNENKEPENLFKDKRGELLPGVSGDKIPKEQELPDIEDYQRQEKIEKLKPLAPETEKIIEKTESQQYQQTPGPIEPFNSDDRIDDLAEDIREDIQEQAQEQLEEDKKIDDSIEVSEDTWFEQAKSEESVSEEEKPAEETNSREETSEKPLGVLDEESQDISSDVSDFEDIGVYNPDEQGDEKKQSYEYNFDDDEY